MARGGQQPPPRGGHQPRRPGARDPKRGSQHPPGAGSSVPAGGWRGRGGGQGVAHLFFCTEGLYFPLLRFLKSECIASPAGAAAALLQLSAAAGRL